ncbi:hypothetical protein PMZ80_008665 [Knufia obscura]|uniref:AB hydrolase-1 domain-containing protein n=1 Tax=Knufia obscura TaxID=1635080 RepID=A0ABR0RFG9_9EURO|nr:hypothetical protein PMZ80_008665 [Knufia obscura]
MASTASTIIFVPGAWHTTKCYDIVIGKLQDAGYTGKLIRCELPSVGAEPGSPAMWSMVPDIKAIDDAIAHEVDSDTPVLLVAHSYGSVPASCAIKKFADSGMVKFCIVAGFMLEFAESMISWCGGVPPPLWRREGDYVYPNNPEEAFYNDLPEDMQKELLGELRSHSYAFVSPSV